MIDASMFHIDNILLNDKCNFSLWAFYILTTGESWYNKFGFKSNQYDSEKKYNNVIINYDLNTFTRMMLEKDKEKKLKKLISMQQESKIF